jgi:glycosyltransferase involved in cell wall biosynthesis
MANTVSVIIPTYNEAAYLPGLLAALKAQTYPPEEIIVADAGSCDGTVEIALRAGCQVVPGGCLGPGVTLGRLSPGVIFFFSWTQTCFHTRILSRIFWNNF